MATATRRHQPTEAQRAQAADRRARFRQLARSVAALSEAQRVEMAAQSMPQTIEGHTLSIHNACLLIMQHPTVTVVGGFRQWKAAGRHVRKGEHGLMLWVPIARVKPEASEGDDGDSDRLGFIMGTVFDISQTEDGATVQIPVPVDPTPGMRAAADALEVELGGLEVTP